MPASLFGAVLLDAPSDARVERHGSCVHACGAPIQGSVAREVVTMNEPKAERPQPPAEEKPKPPRQVTVQPQEPVPWKGGPPKQPALPDKKPRPVAPGEKDERSGQDRDGLD
jgi:hypothetical protein